MMACQCGGKTMRKNLHEFGEWTTFHGIPEMLNGETCTKRVIWAILFLLAAALFGYLMVQIIFDYKRSPTTMKTSSAITDELATIELGLMAFSQTKVVGLGLTAPVMPTILARLQNPAMPYQLANPVLPVDPTALIPTNISTIMNTHSINNFTQLLEAISFDVEDIFWNEENTTGGTYFYSTLKNNTRQELKRVIDDRGVTFEAKISRLDAQSLSSSANLALKMNIDDTINQRWAAGALVKYLNSIYLKIGDQSKNIRTGYAYEVSVAVTETRLLNKYNQPCQTQNSLTTQECEQNCTDVRTECDFGCGWFKGRGQPDPKPFCTIFPQKFLKGNCLDDFSNCTKTCIPPCNSKSYALKWLEMEVPNATADITIYFTVQGNGFLTVVTEEYIYTWSIIMSNIGGMLGLCLGASVLSVVHLVYFIFEKCLYSTAELKGKVHPFKRRGMEEPMEEGKEQPIKLGKNDKMFQS